MSISLYMFCLMVKCKECNYLIMTIELKITIIIVYWYFCLVAAAVVVNYDDVFFSFCFCLLLLLLLLFVWLFVWSFFPFAKLVIFRFLYWFSISLTCSIYIHVTFFCTLVLGSTNIFYYIPVNLCHFFVYLKVDGGQLESRCYFDHHTHFLTCIVIILSCNHVL